MPAQAGNRAAIVSHMESCVGPRLRGDDAGEGRALNVASRGRQMSLKIDGTLLLAGAGNMGVAMLAGWLEGGLAPALTIVQDPAPPPRTKELLDRHGIKAQGAIASLPKPPAVIVVAVKPQVMDEVLPPLAKLAGKDTVVLSIAAGRTIAGFEKHL